MNLQELLDIADRVVGTLANYDLEVRELDLPGIPDSVWADLTSLCGVLSRAVEDKYLEYKELDFVDGQYELDIGSDDEQEEDTYSGSN